MTRRAVLAPLLAAVLAACGRTAAPPPAGPPPGPTVPLRAGNAVLQVEVADTDEESRLGLMHRRSLPEDHGMLFVFPFPRQAGFWMRNTLIPLSIGFLDSEGVLLEVHDMQPLDEVTTVSRSLRVRYALEVNQGWFRRRGIAPGQRFELPPGLVNRSTPESRPAGDFPGGSR